VIVTNKDLRVIKYDKQFKVIEDSTCGIHKQYISTGRKGAKAYNKTELNRQANHQEKDLQCVQYDMSQTVAGMPVGQGSTANVYRMIEDHIVTAVMSNKRHGQDSIEVIMNREKEWFKEQDRKYQAWKEETDND
jgi:hypothetical protein